VVSLNVSPHVTHSDLGSAHTQVPGYTGRNQSNKYLIWCFDSPHGCDNEDGSDNGENFRAKFINFMESFVSLESMRRTQITSRDLFFALVNSIQREHGPTALVYFSELSSSNTGRAEYLTVNIDHVLLVDGVQIQAQSSSLSLFYE